MKTTRKRVSLGLESLEGRVALSGVGGLGEAVHHHRHGVGHAQVAKVHATATRVSDDPAGHDANHVIVGGKVSDDPAGHDAGEVHGGRRGKDDPAGHR